MHSALIYWGMICHSFVTWLKISSKTLEDSVVGSNQWICFSFESNYSFSFYWGLGS